MRILITGGLGYVGGRIVSHLLSTNAELKIDISSRRKVDVQEIFNSNRVFLIEAENLFDDQFPLQNEYDAVIHLAATNETDALLNTAESIIVNIYNSQILLQKAITNKVKRFIYFSTAHVYGAPLKGVIHEEVCPKPIHPYAITHKAFEDFIWAAHQKNEIEGVIVRLSNSFGAPVMPDVNRWTLLVNDLCRQAVMQKKLVLKSSGKQQRDFITLEDVAAATEHLLKIPHQLLGDAVFNLGGNSVYSIYEMAKMIQERAVYKLKMDIPIERPAVDETETVLPLDFQSKKMASTGFTWKNNTVAEIDALLEFCLKHFQ